MTSIIIAAINGSDIFKNILTLIGVGLIAYVLWWLIDFIKTPEPINKVAKALVAIVIVAFLIDVILKVTGHPGYINW